MPTAHKPNLIWSFTNLWTKIKRDSSARTFHISQGDIVVFVVGPTGSGKSWFTREATKSDLVKASRGIHPSTGKVHAIRCELVDGAKRDLQGVDGIVFVDTPSFLIDCDYPNAYMEIGTWLSQTEIKCQPQNIGVIYMHRVETDPALESMKDHLQEFSTIPGVSNGWRLPQRVHIVISYDNTSGRISESKIIDHRSKLRAEMDRLAKSRWQPSMHESLFQGEPETAWRAVEELFRS